MRSKSGFSLIEVLIFVSILSIFFVIAVSVITTSLRNMIFNEHKMLATRYAEDLSEWVRGDKENDWDSFSSRAGKSYCFSSSLSDSTEYAEEPATGCANGDGVGLPELFSRKLTLSSGGTEQVNSTIIVSWIEFGNSFNVTLQSQYNLWE